MKKLTILFILFITLTLISFAWANPFFNNNHNRTTGIYVYGGAGGAGGMGGMGGTGIGGSANSTANNALTSTITANPSAASSLTVESQKGIGKNKGEAKRGLAEIPTAGGPAEARFREDNHNIETGDWRVFPFVDIIKHVTIWDYESGNKLSANLDKKKMHKNLLRVMDKKTKMLEYVPDPPAPVDENDMVIFLGWIPMSPDTKRGGVIAWLSDDGPIDLTTWNMVGNQVVSGCEAGATHLVPVKEGFTRGGHSEVDFLGLAGGGSSVFEQGTKRAGGGSASIGPSTTTMNAWDVDRPYVVVEAWCRISDVDKVPGPTENK